MIRGWLGIALLSASWLFGLSYFFPAQPLVWLLMVASGTVLLMWGQWSEHIPPGSADECAVNDVRLAWHSRSQASLWIAVLAILPAALMPWPHKAIPVLLLLSAIVSLFSSASSAAQEKHRNPFSALAGGALIAAATLLAQAILLHLYAAATARTHDLPWPIPGAVAWAAQLIGIDATAVDSTLVVQTDRQLHRLATTWEWLLDPASLMFLGGGAVWLAFVARRYAPGDRWRAWVMNLRQLAIVLALWLPLRVTLLLAVYLERVLRADSSPLATMDHFFSPWVLGGLLIVPTMAAWRWCASNRLARGRDAGPTARPVPVTGLLQYGVAAMGLIVLASAALAAGMLLVPVGQRKAGRVMFVERHSDWEPTTRKYDTTWYGELSGYNYGLLYDYLGQYYQMSRLQPEQPIQGDTLAGCDVLVIKTPTERYAADEIAAVHRFVEQGGSLLLVGDHTNFERGTTVINDITRAMGFVLRPDLLFSFGPAPYEQHVAPAPAAHPAVKYEPTDFAVSCSIAPGLSLGRAAIQSSGLWSMGPEYHFENFHPVPQHCPQMRAGAFIQLWDTHYGRGRVLAFTDSTIFSNFALPQPGKAELMLGMVEYLNHSRAWPLWPVFYLLAAVAAAAAVWLARGSNLPLGAVLAAALLGWTLGSEGVAAWHARSMPRPPRVRPLKQVVVDRGLSHVPLVKGAFPQGGEQGYGLMEMWLPRLGYFTTRGSGPSAFTGDVLVIINPSEPVTDDYRTRIERFVAGGGRLLVLDTPENTRSTANAVLWPFPLRFERGQPWQGVLTISGGWPGLRVEQAWEVSGGETLARFGERPVAAIAPHGRGRVMAIGFGSTFNDPRMGEMWMLEPTAEVRTRYEVLDALVRRLVEERPIAAPANAPPGPAAELPALPEPKSELPEPGAGLLEP